MAPNTTQSVAALDVYEKIQYDPKIRRCWNHVVPKIKFDKKLKAVYKLKSKITKEQARRDPRINRKSKVKVKSVDLRTEPIVVLVDAPTGSVHDHSNISEQVAPTKNTAVVSTRVPPGTECHQSNIRKRIDPSHFQVPQPQQPLPKPEELFTVRRVYVA